MRSRTRRRRQDRAQTRSSSSGFPSPGIFEQQFDISSEMIDAVSGDRRPALGLRQDECALQNRLSMEREARGAPAGVQTIAPHRFLDVGLDLCDVAADRSVDGIAYCRVTLVDFLH